MIEINNNITIPESEYQLQFARSSGPGGQNVNKVNSKVILSWNIAANQSIRFEAKKRFRAKFANRINQEGFVVITSEKFRDQPQNIRDCKEKLQRMILETLLPPKKRVPTKPTKSSVDKRINNKKNRSQTKKNRQKVNY